MGSQIEEPRNARSRRTAAALLSAARGLLDEQGFEAATMAAVAERAGVSRKAAYLHFDSRADLLAALYEHVNQTEGLAESLAPVLAAPDATAALREWAFHTARFAPRILGVARAVERVYRDDPDVARHRDRSLTGRRHVCRQLIARLAEEGRLARPWTVDDAADMLMALVSLDIVETLIVNRRWSRRRLAEHLADVFQATFVACPGEPRQEAGTSASADAQDGQIRQAPKTQDTSRRPVSRSPTPHNHLSAGVRPRTRARLGES